ncbi:MAG: ABC transporter substrate-binding protein [Chitinophagaceae bacterium]|nr:MAG: ABC transporter substrate-binding protein [Chitinophagaceae bacterium]
MIFRKPSTVVAAWLIFSIILLSGCRERSMADKKIFRYNETTGIASLDPAFAKNQSIMWAVHQLYSTLVEVDANGTIQPLLAKSWDFSPDKKSIVFHLRTDVFFHDDAAFANGKGRKLLAEDVRYSLDRIIDAGTASPGAWIFNNRVDSINPFVALNDSSFQVNLLKPFHPILGILSMQYCSVVPREAVEKYGISFRSHAVGTGPFSFVAWEEGQALVMKKNEHYFEKDSAGIPLPYLDGVKVNFYDSKATEFLEFRQGRLDFINDIDPSFKDEVLTKTGNLKKKWEGMLYLNKHPYLNIEYFGILHDSANALLQQSPLRFKKVRQAINYAINRKKMMLYLRNSIGTAAESGFVPQGLPSFDAEKVKGYSYDINKARQLLSEAGFPNGKGLPEIKLLTIPIYTNLASYVANELKQVGINIQVESIQKSLLLEQTSKSQALFFRGSWIADYPDAENYLSVFYSKNPAPPNYTRYKNLQFDRLYEQALEEENDSVRYELYRSMDRLIVEDAPVVPFWYDMVIHLVHNNVSGFKANSLNMLELRKVRKQ